MNTKTMLGPEISQECMYFYFFINGNEIKEIYKISLVHVFICYCVGCKSISNATMNYNFLKFAMSHFFLYIFLLRKQLISLSISKK
jgi:hypothetical protein